MRAFQTYSTTAADNASSDSTANKAEGMAAGIINNSMRADTARLAAIFAGIAGAITLGGSANARTFTSPTGHALQTAYSQPLVLWAKSAAANTGATTLNVDGLGAVAVKRQNGDALEADDIASGGVYGFAYDGTVFRLLNPEGAGEILDAIADHVAAGDPHTQYVLTSEIGTAVQAYSVLLTAFAGSGPSAGDFWYAASATTVSKQTSAAYGRAFLAFADEATFKAAVNLEAGVDFEAVDANIARVATAKTWTAAQTFERAVDADLVNYSNTTTTHDLSVRFASSGTLWELTPAPSATPDNTKGFGYDFTNSRWYCDTVMMFNAAGSSSIATLQFVSANVGFFQSSAGIVSFTSSGTTVAAFGAGVALDCVTSPLRTSGGSSSAPAIAHRTDTNTGVRWPNNDTFIACAGGSDVAILTTSGWTDASSSPLEVAGKQNIPIPAAAMVPNTTNGAATGTTETTTNKVMVQTLDFDQTTQESAQFAIAMPKGWNESTVTFQPCWTASAGTGGVVWELRALALSDDDALDTAWGTGQTSTDTLLATGDVHWGPESSAITVGNTPAELDIVWFQIRRVPADASDTLNADAKLIAIRLSVTTNAKNDA